MCRANYLASPPLVVAYALAGRMDFDIVNEPLGNDKAGKPVYLRDIWPTPQEVESTVRSAVSTPKCSTRNTRDVFTGDAHWRALARSRRRSLRVGRQIHLHQESAVLRRNAGKARRRFPICAGCARWRCSATASPPITFRPPARFRRDSPAGKYLIAHGVKPKDFNSYGARRGNHEVMMRGTFANIRLRNQLAPGTEGGWTVHQPGGEKMTIYDAAMKYREEGVPLVVIAGKEYGSGSSRDWAAKGTLLLGVRAVIAESFERIHRSNLVGMGVLPLEFAPGEDFKSLGLTGLEIFDFEGLSQNFEPKKRIKVRARDAQGKEKQFTAIARVDTPFEVAYYQHGGILQYVLRQML